MNQWPCRAEPLQGLGPRSDHRATLRLPLHVGLPLHVAASLAGFVISIAPVHAQSCSDSKCPPSSSELQACRPTEAQPSLPRGLDLDARPTFSAGDWELLSDDTLSLTNGVELKQGDRIIRTDEIRRLGDTGQWSIPGAVELSDPTVIVRGESANADTEAGTVDFTNTSFELPGRFGRGSASYISLSSEGAIGLRDVSYTTCPGDKPDWELNVGALDIDSEARQGSARNAWVNFKGVPVFYTPYISFPVGNEPMSGLLAPAIGDSSRSGRQVSIPWYWRIASNYDATLTPTWYSRRGVDAGAEFRFLTRTTEGQLRGNYLPDDQLTGEDRSFVSLLSQTDFTSRLRLDLQGSNVSDSRWLEDFGASYRTGVIVLPRWARLFYRGDEWMLSAVAQNYQTIDVSIPLDDRPYTLLPQVGFDGWFPDRPYGLTYGVVAEYSRFQPSTHSTKIEGQRLDATPEIRLPLRRPGIYVEPAVAWRYTAYQLEDENSALIDDTFSRSAPIFSLDSGLIFERPSGHEGQRVQTLEPRLLYLYVPYRPQDSLPVFDTKQPDFNLIQLFAANRYVGADRLGDANQVAFGVTTRLLDADSGEQYLAATLGEVYRFEQPRVSLPGEVLPTYSSSDIIGELQLSAYKNWSANLGAQWDPNSQTLQRTEAFLQFRPGPGRVINAGYVYRRSGLTQLPGLEQVDTSAAWPIGSRFHLYGRYVYSLEEQKTIEGLAGIEYRDCCWGMRFFARRSRSLTGELEDSWQWQIELNGLSSVGTGNDAFLAQAIRGYSAARFDRASVP
jgi:LPS-assembly protein